MMRAVAPAILRQRGYEISSVMSPEFLTGSRLIGVRFGSEYDFAVKACDGRRISFARRADGKWATLKSVDFMVVIVPTDDGVKEAEVMAFTARILIQKFEQAWQELKANGHPIVDGRVSIPLDQISKKKSVHGIANIKAVSLWSVEVTRSQVKATRPTDNFFDRVRREFADRLGLDVHQVEVDFKF